VLPYWPRNRFLELCPSDWRVTRDRFDPAELERELGPLTVPPLPSSEQPVTR
jgi:transposase